MRIRPTGSKVHRVWKCPASAVLPQIEEDERKNQPARDRGKQIHRYLERVKAIGEAEALAEQPPELWPLLKALDLSALPVHLATEVAYAWDWRAKRARELGRGIDRDYDAAGVDWTREIPLTIDIVGSQGVSASWVRAYDGDYKSGHSKYPPPDMFGQTLLAGCATCALLGADDAVLELIHIHDDGDHHKVRRLVDQWQLEAFADDLAAAMDMVDHWEAEYTAGRSVAVNEGPWCDHCPAYRSCPAKVALVKAIPAELRAFGVRQTEDGRLEEDPSAITVAKAAEQWMAVERIEEVLRHIKSQICGLAGFEEIPLPDGRVIGFLKTERRELVGAIAAQVLTARYGREAADEAVELTCSMEALKKACSIRKKEGEVMQSKHGTGVVDLVLKEIDRLGGVKINVTEGIKPHVPKRKKLSQKVLP